MFSSFTKGDTVVLSLMFIGTVVPFGRQDLGFFTAKPMPEAETKMIPIDPMTIAPSLLAETWYVDLMHRRRQRLKF